jgi:hypothetical protein
MGIAELKEQLHKKIDALDDIELLGAVNELLIRHPVFKIPAEYLSGIQQGIQDAENNEFITLHEFEVKYHQWLKD